MMFTIKSSSGWSLPGWNRIGEGPGLLISAIAVGIGIGLKMYHTSQKIYEIFATRVDPSRIVQADLEKKLLTPGLVFDPSIPLSALNLELTGAPEELLKLLNDYYIVAWTRGCPWDKLGVICIGEVHDDPDCDYTNKTLLSLLRGNMSAHFFVENVTSWSEPEPLYANRLRERYGLTPEDPLFGWDCDEDLYNYGLLDEGDLQEKHDTIRKELDALRKDTSPSRNIMMMINFFTKMETTCKKLLDQGIRRIESDTVVDTFPKRTNAMVATLNRWESTVKGQRAIFIAGATHFSEARCIYDIIPPDRQSPIWNLASWRGALRKHPHAILIPKLVEESLLKHNAFSPTPADWDALELQLLQRHRKTQILIDFFRLRSCLTDPKSADPILQELQSPSGFDKVRFLRLKEAVNHYDLRPFVAAYWWDHFEDTCSILNTLLDKWEQIFSQNGQRPRFTPTEQQWECIKRQLTQQHGDSQIIKDFVRFHAALTDQGALQALILEVFLTGDVNTRRLSQLKEVSNSKHFKPLLPHEWSEPLDEVCLKMGKIIGAWEKSIDAKET
jgi:hypothetical protein